jgi:hypothetical protein
VNFARWWPSLARYNQSIDVAFVTTSEKFARPGSVSASVGRRSRTPSGKFGDGASHVSPGARGAR